MNKDEKYLIAVVGPTAIGKTSMAISLAKQYGCEIISCDSRQFYKEMTIGTAVPSKDELSAARHHFIHNKSIFDNYTVGDFERDALAKLDELFEANDVAVMVGGSGLYVDAVLRGFDDFPEVDPKIRQALNENYESSGIGYLQTELQRLDPDYYKVVDRGNPQRLMRALEVSIGTNTPYSAFLLGKKNKRNFTPIVVGLEADRETMYDRINRRVDLMIGEGLVDEARALYTHKELNALQTVGYRELFAFFDGECDLDFAVSEIKKNTRRFAKRQMTWFKRNQQIKWFDFLTPAPEVAKYLQEVIRPR